MQIIIVSPSLDPTKNVSGISSVTQFIIHNNTEHGYIHFELGRKDGERGGVCRVWSIMRSLRQWRRLLKQYPDAVIHYNFPLEKPSILRDPLFMQVARWMGRKMVVHIHGGVFLTALSIPFPFKQILQHIFNWDVPFITLSDGETKTLKERFGVKKVITLPNCVDLRNAEAFVHQAKQGSEPLILGYLGRIAETKGMDYLLQACTTLQQNGIPFLLKMAGAEEVTGKYIPTFQQALGDSFEFCGLVSGQSKCDFLRSLDIFVMPTFFEGLPMSLLECMSYGAVPVVTPVGSIPDVVTNEANGLFVKVKEVAPIVSAITTLHHHRAFLHELSKEAKATIFTHFNTQNYICNLNNLYNKLT